MLTGALVVVLAACQYIGADTSPSAQPTPTRPSATSPGASGSVESTASPRAPDRTVQPSAPHTSAPSLAPEESIDARLREQAEAALAHWADVAADAPPNAVVFVHDLTRGGGWRGRGAGDRKSAFLSGLVQASVDLPTEAPPPAEVEWPDGSSTTVSLISAAQALADLTSHRDGGGCDGCRPLDVTGAKLVMGEAETSRGPATVPLWRFSFAPADEPLTPITHVAVKDRIAVVSTDEWDPYGDNPIGDRIEAAYGTPVDSQITVVFVGSPHSGESWCGADYTAEAVESDLAVVVIVHGHSNPREPRPTGFFGCTLEGAARTALVELDAPIGNRTVLEVQFGTPVSLRPEDPPPDGVRD